MVVHRFNDVFLGGYIYIYIASWRNIYVFSNGGASATNCYDEKQFRLLKYSKR